MPAGDTLHVDGTPVVWGDTVSHLVHEQLDLGTANGDVGAVCVGSYHDFGSCPRAYLYKLNVFIDGFEAAAFARPSGDTQAGGWTSSSGIGTLASHIDETVLDDTDYIESGINPAAETYIGTLSTITDPGIDTGFTFRYWYGTSAVGGKTITFDFSLWHGANQIDTWQHATVDDIGQIAGSRAIANTVIDDITDFSTLSFRVTATVDGAGADNSGRVYMIEMEGPTQAPTANDTIDVYIAEGDEVGTDAFSGPESPSNTISGAGSTARLPNLLGPYQVTIPTAIEADEVRAVFRFESSYRYLAPVVHNDSTGKFLSTNDAHRITITPVYVRQAVW
jgi:hypothetical protein